MSAKNTPKSGTKRAASTLPVAVNDENAPTSRCEWHGELHADVTKSDLVSPVFTDWPTRLSRSSIRHIFNSKQRQLRRRPGCLS